MNEKVWYSYCRIEKTDIKFIASYSKIDRRKYAMSIDIIIKNEESSQTINIYNDTANSEQEAKNILKNKKLFNYRSRNTL